VIRLVAKEADMTAAVLSREGVRALDRRAIEELGLSGAVLMENAGRGAAELLLRLGIHGRVVICCGKGNNGGDGFVIARHLAKHEVDVRVLLLGRPEELTIDAAANYRSISRAGVPICDLTEERMDEEWLWRELVVSEWVVDALFGTGLTRAVRPPFDRIIAIINESAAKVLAVDLPSGMDCDTGQPLGAAVRAHRTATMAAWKIGFLQPAAQPWLGQVHLIDIGLPLAW
jgi:NAD(P)H-hydrate epimerase